MEHEQEGEKSWQRVGRCERNETTIRLLKSLKYSGSTKVSRLGLLSSVQTKHMSFLKLRGQQKRPSGESYSLFTLWALSTERPPS